MWRMIATIVQRELLFVWRDRAGVFLLLFVPALAISIGGFALHGLFNGAPSQIALTVDDQDGGRIARLIVTRLRHVPLLRVSRTQISAADPSVMRIIIPRGFSARYERAEPAEITFEPDPGRVGEGYVVRSILNEIRARLAAGQTAARLAATQIVAATGDVDLRRLRAESVRVSARSTVDAVKIVERQRPGVTTLRSFDLQVPGLAVMFLLFGMLSGVGRRMLDDQATGRMRRMLLAPGGLGAVLTGVLVARGLVGILQIIVLLLFGHLVFHVPLGSSSAALALVVLATVVAAVSFGAMLGGVAGSDEQLNALGVAGILAMSALGGCWWPLYLEPQWMQRLADLTITKWAMQSLTDVMLREATLRQVGLGALWLGVFAAASLAIGLLGYRRRLAME